MADSFEEGTASGPAAPSAVRRARAAGQLVLGTRQRRSQRQAFGQLAREGHWFEDWHWQQANWPEGNPPRTGTGSRRVDQSAAADEPQPQLSASLPGWVSRRQKALVEKHAEDSKALLDKHAVEDSSVEGEDGAVEDSAVEDRPQRGASSSYYHSECEEIPPLPPRPPPPRPSQKSSTRILEDLEEQLKELKEEGNRMSVLTGGPVIWNLEEEDAVIDWYSEEELQIKIANAKEEISDLHRIKSIAEERAREINRLRQRAREINRSRDAGPHRQDDMQEERPIYYDC